MSDKPGVMIYFDMISTLKQMSDRQAGILFRAILQYGATGRPPELPDSLRLLWPMIETRLIADHQRYKTVSFKRRYAAYVKWSEKRGETVLPYEQWICNQEDVEEYQLRYT